MRIDFPVDKKFHIDNDNFLSKENKTQTPKSNEEDAVLEIAQSNIKSAKSGILEVEKAVKLVDFIKKQIEEEVSSAIAAQANTTSNKVINIIS